MLFYQGGQQLGLFNKESNQESRFSNLDELEEIVSKCKRCSLHKGCKNVVFGTGNSKTGLLFVGEGPGQDEDLQGIPFVGKAGQLLDKILTAAEIRREDVYIANIVKCRPPGNRNPTETEMKTCLWFLAQQIKLIQPTIIVPLGSVAVKGLLDPAGKITELRGNWIERSGYYFLPTFHPAALLRNERWKKVVWRDFLKIKKAYERYQKLKKQGKF
jgi:DNA polymerase